MTITQLRGDTIFATMETIHRFPAYLRTSSRWGDADDEEAAPAAPAVVPKVKAIRKKQDEGPVAS